MIRDFKIWVDGDACPVPIKNILCRAADRHSAELIFVANKKLRLPASPQIKLITVSTGPDAADEFISAHVKRGHLVITADIPLAAAIVEKEAVGLNFRGEFFNEDNIRHILSVRNLMSDLRSAGIETTKHAPFNYRDRENFANALQGFLQRLQKSQNE